MCLQAMILLVTIHCAFAQSSNSSRLIVEDGWIEKMNNKIALDISLNNAYEIFSVKTTDDRFILSPNAAANLRLKVNYRFISFGLQFAPGFIPGNKDDDLKGETKSFGLGTSVILRHWILDLSYSNVKGYYLVNSEDYIPMSGSDPFIQFPDLTYKGFALTTGYSSNSKFSFRSLSSQTERQLKSAGSFIPVVDLRYFIIDNKSSGATTQKTNNFESSIGPGYIYTFVAKKSMYVSLGLLSSVGYLNTKLTTRYPDGDVVTHQDNFIFRWEGKAGVGYNGKKFYSGLYATLSGTQYKQEHTTAVNTETRAFYHIFFGIRLNSPKFVKKQVDKVEELIPKN